MAKSARAMVEFTYFVPTFSAAPHASFTNTQHCISNFSTTIQKKRKDDENATGEDQGATGEDILAGGSRQDFVGGVGVQPVSMTTTTDAIKTRHLPAMAVKYTLGEGNILSGVPSKEDLMELSEVTKMAMESKLISWFDEKYGLDYSGYSGLEVGGAVSSHADGVIIYSPKVHFFKGEKVAGADRLAQEIFGLFSDSTDYITTLNDMTLNNEFSKTVSVEYKLVEYAP